MANVTRGGGILEKFLSEMRCKKANQLIPKALRNGSLLDIGCGNTPFFLQNTQFEIKTGLDKLVNKPTADQIMIEHNIQLVQHDFENKNQLPFENDKFEVVTMLAVFEHIEVVSLRTLLKEIHRVLKPGGYFIMTTPAAWTELLLKILSQLKLVSAEEINEHKDAYSHQKIAKLLAESGFERTKMKLGYFELFLNNWASAKK